VEGKEDINKEKGKNHAGLLTERKKNSSQNICLFSSMDKEHNCVFNTSSWPEIQWTNKDTSLCPSRENLSVMVGKGNPIFFFQPSMGCCEFDLKEY